MFKEIKKCTLCGSRELTSILDLNDQPPANSLRLNYDRKLQNVPLILCFVIHVQYPN